jgi:UDP-2,3-diacylglucosamine pyrophosphatase LpxH
MKEEAPFRIQARNEQCIKISHAVVFWVMATHSHVTNTTPPSSEQKKQYVPSGHWYPKHEGSIFLHNFST